MLQKQILVDNNRYSCCGGFFSTLYNFEQLFLFFIFSIFSSTITVVLNFDGDKKTEERKELKEMMSDNVGFCSVVDWMSCV